jgi:hypothetical protein
MAAVTPRPLSDRERAQFGPRQLKQPGTPDWCWQTVTYLKDCMRHVEEEWRQAEQVLEDLMKTRAWRVIPADQPYGTLNKMLKAEIGLDEKAIRDLIRKAELAAIGANYSAEAKGFARGDNITSEERGTSEIYTIRRLRRDRPDLAERVEHGELTANQAAINAGFRRRSMSIPVDDAERAFRRLSGDKGMDREQLILLAALLKEHLLNEQEN